MFFVLAFYPQKPISLYVLRINETGIQHMIGIPWTPADVHFCVFFKATHLKTTQFQI